MQNTLSEQNSNILIVDDVEANLVSLESLLEEEPCHIVRAGSGKEALAKVLDMEFALILLDVQMPNMDGYETASLIRGVEKTRYIPIIFITASRKEESYVFKGYQKGAVDYLYKPLDPIILKSKVRVFLELYGQKQLIRDQILELERNNEEMTRLKDLADKANQAKSEFLSRMNHEIRTPLNAIFGYAQIIKLDQKSLLPKQQKAMDGIYRAGQHLMRLIESVLDLAKIEAGHMDLKIAEFDLVEVINDLKVMFEPACKQSGLDFIIDFFELQSVWVFGDEQKLKQVLINLIGNAVKFTEKGSVTLRVIPLEEARFQFEIIDTGPGIQKDKQPRIFDPFQQTQLGNSKGGSGLGLSISQNYVNLMGGTLMLISEPGKGCDFKFTIPLHSAINKTEDPEIFRISRYRMVSDKRVTALIVDDIPDNVEALAQILNDLGVEVRSANNGKEALEEVKALTPDIIFMDYHMPDLNGLEASTEIRKIVPSEQLKIILISASVLSYQMKEILKQNAYNGFIGKPFIQRDIINALETHLKIVFEKQEELQEGQAP